MFIQPPSTPDLKELYAHLLGFVPIPGKTAPLRQILAGRAAREFASRAQITQAGIHETIINKIHPLKGYSLDVKIGRLTNGSLINVEFFHEGLLENRLGPAVVWYKDNKISYLGFRRYGERAKGSSSTFWLDSSGLYLKGHIQRTNGRERTTPGSPKVNPFQLPFVM